MQLILGSQSPRRQEILSFFACPFTQVSPPFDEALIPFENDPTAYTQTLSRGKALSLVERYPNAIILTADTCVWKEGKLFEKPADDKEALEMLHALNGARHTVYTAVTAKLGEKEETLCQQTHIQFHHLSTDQLELYHRAFTGTDMAGGYGIQKSGSVIVKWMEGCFYNVMGLPITATCEVLSAMGMDLWHYLA
ncbi:MAG: dTTP/UTP pyrophosphatase [Chlamydiales bacterium]|nr:dTTP/UTP pyrophosphatase [Chlamydiales bacterium]